MPKMWASVANWSVGVPLRSLDMNVPDLGWCPALARTVGSEASSQLIPAGGLILASMRMK